jgi:hypothetical protein
MVHYIDYTYMLHYTGGYDILSTRVQSRPVGFRNSYGRKSAGFRILIVTTETLCHSSTYFGVGHSRSHY